MRRFSIVVGVVFAILLTAHIVGYVVAVNSDAYAAAARFVQDDPSISSEIGAVSKTSLAPLDAELRFTGYSGEAKFAITTQTTKGSFKVIVQLEKSSNGWRVVNSHVL